MIRNLSPKTNVLILKLDLPTITTRNESRITRRTCTVISEQHSIYPPYITISIQGKKHVIEDVLNLI